MTSQILANPRRTSLAALLKGSVLGGCAGVDGAGCRNVAVRVVDTAEGPRHLCRSCGSR
jgi:hypothetical protein